MRPFARLSIGKLNLNFLAQTSNNFVFGFLHKKRSQERKPPLCACIIRSARTLNVLVGWNYNSPLTILRDCQSAMLRGNNLQQHERFFVQTHKPKNQDRKKDEKKHFGSNSTSMRRKRVRRDHFCSVFQQTKSLQGRGKLSILQGLLCEEKPDPVRIIYFERDKTQKELFLRTSDVGDCPQAIMNLRLGETFFGALFFFHAISLSVLDLHPPPKTSPFSWNRAKRTQLWHQTLCWRHRSPSLHLLNDVCGIGTVL